MLFEHSITNKFINGVYGAYLRYLVGIVY